MNRLALIAILVVGCGNSKTSPEPAPTAVAEDEPVEPTDEVKPEEKADPNACADAPGWRFEPIALPPEFAPTMPPGKEKLYFAPGMFKADDPGYWSYVFSLEFEKDAPKDIAAVEKLLIDYYAGLIAAVAKGKGTEVADPAATVKVAESSTGFTALVKTTDAFVTNKKITVMLSITGSKDNSCLNVAASVAPPDAEVWTQLDSARRCVPCP